MTVESDSTAPAEAQRDGGENEFDNIRLVLQEGSLSAGTLTITQTGLKWAPSSDVHQPWGTEFVDMSLHAISTDEDSGYPPCIYAQYGDECEEVRLIPDDRSHLTEIYDALCEGAEKNIDDQQRAGLGDLFGGVAGAAVEGADDDQPRLGGAGDVLARLDGMLQVPEGMEQVSDDATIENGVNHEGETSR